MNNRSVGWFYFFLTGTSYRVEVLVDGPTLSFFTGKGDTGTQGPRAGRITVRLPGVSLSSACFLHGLMCMIRASIPIPTSLVSDPSISAVHF